jgi:FHA domain
VAPAAVTLVLDADRGHWDRVVGSGEPAFPAVAPTLTFELRGEAATLGRVRSGAPVDVDLALTGAAADPAVSHHQCEFERDGSHWLVRDAESSNGTWINDAAEPLAAGEAHRLADGDRILMGAWTCLTVHVAPTS